MLGWSRFVISADSRTKLLLVFWLAPSLSVLMATSVVPALVHLAGGALAQLMQEPDVGERDLQGAGLQLLLLMPRAQQRVHLQAARPAPAPPCTLMARADMAM